MIRVKKPGSTPGTEKVIFELAQGKLEFPTFLEARKWQFKMIFGEAPDFSHLEGYEESYIHEIFDLKNEFAPHLVTGEPCRIAHLQKLVNALHRNINVENYLVIPTF